MGRCGTFYVLLNIQGVQIRGLFHKMSQSLKLSLLRRAGGAVKVTDYPDLMDLQINMS